MMYVKYTRAQMETLRREREALFSEWKLIDETFFQLTLDVYLFDIGGQGKC